MVLAASFLTFVDFFGSCQESRCFGFPIVDLFSLVKLPVVFGHVRTTGPIRSRSLQVLLFSSSGPPCGGNWGVFGDVSEARIYKKRATSPINSYSKVLYRDSFSLVGSGGKTVCIRSSEEAECGIKTTNITLVGDVPITGIYWLHMSSTSPAFAENMALA